MRINYFFWGGIIMKRVIMTGATGAIGTALIQELIQHNIEVLVFCRQNSMRNNNIPNHTLVTKFFCPLEQLSSLKNFTGKKYDVFYHFAWEGTTGEARNDMFLQNRNVKYALDAVDVAVRFGCKKFIGAGSQAEYGRVEKMLRPNTPTNPETGYGMAKLCAGYMTKARAQQLGLEYNWVRVLSIYGPNDGAGSMVMTTINNFRKGIIPKFTKGEQMWDYLYSEDAASAFRLIGEKGKDGKVYVLGSGVVRPLREYIMEIRDAVAPEAELRFGEIPYTDKQVMYLCADITELKADLGWKRKTEFFDGIKNISNSLVLLNGK